MKYVALIGMLAAGCKGKSDAQGAAGANAVARANAVAKRLVRIDGSSTVFPIAEAIAEAYRGKGAQITIGVSGTGGGMKKFCAGETDITNASRPIKATEAEACAKAGIEFIEVPVAYDGLTIVVHPTNTWAKEITVAELKTLWEPAAQGKITKWNQVRTAWPDTDIHLFGAGTDSGTYDYFTEAVMGKEDESRGDYTASEDDNILVQGIASDPAALGFFGFAYYEENKARVKAVPIDDGKPDNGAGAITPSLETVQNGTYQPLARPLFIYVSTKSLADAGTTAFVKFFIEQAPSLVKEVGYIPLPPNAYTLAQKRVDGNVTGSLFGNKGSQVGVSIESLLAAETK